jgi:hypothetical protein
MHHKPKQLAFKVVLTMPDGVTIEDMKDYVLRAVSTMRGSCRPPRGYGPDDLGDPLFSLDASSIRVTRLHPRKRNSK